MTTTSPSTRSKPVVDEVVDGVYRVEVRNRTIGYVVRAGRVYVALEGSVYNTSVEVAQTLDLHESVETLRLSA
jgi:hypothetical protein